MYIQQAFLGKENKHLIYIQLFKVLFKLIL